MTPTIAASSGIRAVSATSPSPEAWERFSCYSMQSLLAQYARVVAPPALSATIIGIYYLAFFAANNLVGWLGGLLERMPAIYSWLLHAGLAATAGIIFLIAGRFFGHLFASGEKENAA